MPYAGRASVSAETVTAAAVQADGGCRWVDDPRVVVCARGAGKPVAADLRPGVQSAQANPVQHALCHWVW